MIKLVLLRHGESLWNQKNIFTGWMDIGLSDKGTTEAIKAGKLLAKHKLSFDYAYASVLKRSIKTLWLSLEELNQMWLPTTYAWQLNERHYGALQGMNKKQILNKVGEEQFTLWRRGFSTRPPALKVTDKFYVPWDPRYQGLAKNKMPKTESLADACQRVWPYFQAEIEPKLLAGHNIIISAHGNSLRALIKNLNNISNNDIVKLELATGAPMIFEFKKQHNQLHKVSDYLLK